MIKRKKDLFHVLEQREHEVRTGVAESSAPRKQATRQGSKSPGSVADRLRNWVGAVQGQTRGRRAGASASAPAVAPYGLILAALALVCLGTGFVLGRFLPRTGESATLAARGEDPRRPGPVAPAAPATSSPAAGELPAEKEEEILSNLWFQTLLFPAPQRAEAAQVATFLRASGVETARLRKFQTKSKRDVWVVLAYALSHQTAPTVLAQLEAVPATRTWPSLASEIAKLTVADLKSYTPDNN